MTTFNLYKHPTQGIEAVKSGFSWPAFFFGVVWMVVKKLWVLAVVWFVAYVVFAFLGTSMTPSLEGTGAVINDAISTAGQAALWLVPAFMGNKWREKNLAMRGYEQLTTVEAESPEDAIALVNQPV